MPKKVHIVIDFKFRKGVMEELLEIYRYHLTSFKYEDLHEQLLAEHIKDMYLTLESTYNAMVATAKIAMNNSEALAFYQLWQLIDTTPWPLANVTICDMLKKIDKRIKAPRNTYATK